MRVLVVLCVITGVACCIEGAIVGLESNADDGNQRLVCVNSSEIPKHAKILGPLGTPLGEKVIKIRGKWSEIQDHSRKANGFVFLVRTIDNKPLPKPIEVPAGHIEPFSPDGDGTLVPESGGVRKWSAYSRGKQDAPPDAFDGDDWELTGFETGQTIGAPLAALVFFEHVQNTSQPGAFVTGFRFVIARVFSKPHDKSEIGWSFGKN